MKKILCFNWFDGATEFYRSAPLIYLKSDDYIITQSSETNISWQTLFGYDVIFIERPSSGTSLNIIKLAKDMGIKVIADFDDDCLHLDQYNPLHANYENEKANIIDCLTICDELWVATQGIKKSFAFYNKNIHVIPNAHNDTIFKVEDKKAFNPNTKLAMWRGGSTHTGDIYDIGVPEQIIEIVNSNPDWTFKFIGQRFEYLEKRCGDNYISQGGASTIQFYRMMQDENPNIFFYPLADTIFNRGKSNCSWLEATYAGAAYFGNKNLPEFDQMGNLPITEIERLMNRNDILKIANETSWDNILENFLLSKVNQLRHNRLLAI